MKILLTIPIGSCEAERCFSCMKRIKTALRNRLLNNHLNSLITIDLNGPEELNFEDLDYLCNNIYEIFVKL